MGMTEQLLNMQMTLTQLEKTPMMAKGPVAEKALRENVQLLETVIDQVQLIGESFNGLLAYINQTSDDPLSVEDLNAKMKKGGFGLYGE